MSHIALVMQMAFRIVCKPGKSIYTKFLTLPILSIAFSGFLAIASLSVINGFEYSLREGLLKSIPHVRIIANPINVHKVDYLIDKIKENIEVLGVSEFLSSLSLVINDRQHALGNIIATSDSYILPLFFQGINQSDITKLALSTSDVLVSESLMSELSLNKSVVLYLPISSQSPFGRLPRLKSFRIAESFSIDSNTNNKNLVIMSKEAFTQFIPADLTTYIVDLTIDSPMEISSWAQDIAWQPSEREMLSYWSDSYENLFDSINITRSVMLLILFVIYSVAIFNLTSSSLIEIQSRSKSIAMFKLLGMNDSVLVSIFMLNSLFRALIGILLGVIFGLFFSDSLGSLFVMMEWISGISLIDADVYGVSMIQGKLFFIEMIKLIAAAIFFALAVSYLSARRVLKLGALEALRNE
jgi:lipoprotein-releasing system permease protein